MIKQKQMDTQHKYTVEEVLEIALTLAPAERELLKERLLTAEAEFDRLVKEDFAKYDETFKALA